MVSSRRDDFLGGPGLGPDLDIPAGREGFPGEDQPDDPANAFGPFSSHRREGGFPLLDPQGHAHHPNLEMDWSNDGNQNDVIKSDLDNFSKKSMADPYDGIEDHG